MKRTFAFVLTLECEIDGEAPEEKALVDRIEACVLEGIPGVLCDEDNYAVVINSITIEAAK